MVADGRGFSTGLVADRGRATPIRAPRRCGSILGLTIAAVLCPTLVLGDRVELQDGRVLEGRFALLPGVVIDPIADAGGTAGTPVLVCDDDLTRTMVPKRRVVKVEEGPFDVGLERIDIDQRVPESGRRVAAVGGILGTTPFDDHGRRILSLATGGGRIDVVQGITRITPRWTRLEGLQTEKSVLLDMRVATSSIPRDVLRRVIAHGLDRDNTDDRLRLVRLWLQAGRYDDARAELDDVLRDFPALADLATERQGLMELAASGLLDEIRQRASVGQEGLAERLLESFPVNEASGELVEAVREERDALRQRRERGQRLLAAIRERIAGLEEGPEHDGAARLVDEIASHLSPATLERLSAFERLGMADDLPRDRAVGLAISGWLGGAAAAGENLKLALSTARVRDLLRDYLRSEDAPAREAVFRRLAEEEAFAAPTVAAVARQMGPPIDPPAAVQPGLHELAIANPDGSGTVPCLVQLPPEYDPLRRYPAIVSLHAAWTTPLNQIEWWAGTPGPDGTRLGQAGRHGTIVIAPAWAAPSQTGYDFSAREHGVVLAALREAQRRFSIDTDRVFLSGHSLGGDAAWDIALAHPDLWAGLVAIAPAAGRYVNHYWPNARTLPVYVVAGELDSASLSRNAMDLDRYFAKGFDITYVEYRGRGHEHFSDEILRLFAWMGRRTRSFAPSTIDVVTMRPWDRFFWWVEMAGAPPRTVVLPSQWPPGPNVRPMTIEAKTTATNGLAVRCGAERVTVWLMPELIDFSRPVTVTLDGRRLVKDTVAPDVRVMLEDLRRRGDRQHPFWALVEGGRGQPGSP
jgi:pimeloyl-ACP methyl ester carboxylesterase